MKSIRHILYALLPALLVGGCARGGDSPSPAGETGGGTDKPVEIVYGVTRGPAGTSPSVRAEGKAFSFVSYLLNSNTGAYEPNLNYNTYQRPQGYYTWMPDTDTWKGVMQPCDVDPTDLSVALGRNPLQGQALYNATYGTVCFHPAITLINNGQGTDRILFTRNDARWVSAPFTMNVRGYEIFELPSTHKDTGDEIIPLLDLRSKIFLDIIQGGPAEFEIRDIVVANAGYWGWYHLISQTTQISYDKGAHYDDTRPYHDETGSYTDAPGTGRYNIHDRDNNPSAGSREDLAVRSVPSSADITGEGNLLFMLPGGEDQLRYTTGRGEENGLFFFSNDYTKNTYLQPGLTFRLVMDGGAGFDISIPFSINMKPNNAYLFRMTVESSVVRVKMRVADWEDGFTDIDDNDIIDVGDEEDWIPVGIWTPAGWTQHIIPSEDIGR